MFSLVWLFLSKVSGATNSYIYPDVAEIFITGEIMIRLIDDVEKAFMFLTKNYAFTWSSLDGVSFGRKLPF